MHMGNRGSQEDRAAVVRLPGSDVRVAGVYDGHCGENCADFASRAVPALLMQSRDFREGDFEMALAKTLEGVHAQWLRDASPSDASGTTSSVALVAPFFQCSL